MEKSSYSGKQIRPAVAILYALKLKLNLFYAYQFTVCRCT